MNSDSFPYGNLDEVHVIGPFTLFCLFVCLFCFVLFLLLLLFLVRVFELLISLACPTSFKMSFPL